MTEAVGVSGLQRSSGTTYDAAGNVLVRTDPAGVPTTMTYDALNRQLTTQTPSGGTWTQTYDSAGNLLSRTDPMVHTTTYAYDGLNRQTLTTDARTGRTTSVYDAAGNRVNLIDPVGNQTTFVYDARNRLTQQTDPAGYSATFAYSATDRLTSTTDRDRRRRDLRYDSLDRQTGETWVASPDQGGNPVNTVTYTFDAADNRLSAADQNGAYTMAYDPLNRMTAEQEPFGQALTMNYDAAGNRTSVLDSQGGTTTSAYDALNRVTSRQLTAPAATQLRFDLSYTNRDQLSGVTRYSDVTGNNVVGMTSYGYDTPGRVTSVVHKNAAGATLSYYNAGYDNVDRTTGETWHSAVGGTPDDGSRAYSYDATNELINDGTAAYNYDLNGNRTTAGTLTYGTPGAGNRLSTDGLWSYTYDYEGNLTGKQSRSGPEVWTYGYDNLNRLTSVVQKQDGSTISLQVTYTYDVFGNRIQEQKWHQGGATTTVCYAYDGSNVWADLDGTPAHALLARRVYGAGVNQPIARIVSAGQPNAGVAWYLADRQGSVRDLTDASGVVLAHLNYDVYGKLLAPPPGFADRLQYAAGESDVDTGLIRFNARWYNPATGGWQSEDPLGLGPDSNPYRYVRNGPTNGTDPSGLLDQSTFENAFRERDPYAYDYWTTKLNGHFAFTNYRWYQRPFISLTGYGWWDDRTLGIQLDVSLDQNEAIDYAVKTIRQQGGEGFQKWLKEQPSSKAMVPLTGKSVDEAPLPYTAFLPSTLTRYSKYAGLTADEAIKVRQAELMQDNQFLGSTTFWDKTVSPYMEAYRVAAGELFPERYGALKVPFSARPPSDPFSAYNLNRMFGPDGLAYDALPARGSRSGLRMLARRKAGAASGSLRSFWSYVPEAKGAGTFEYTARYSTRKIEGGGREVVVYWVVDTRTRQVLKVGDTTVDGAVARWGQYVGRARAQQRTIQIEYVRFSESAPRKGDSVENALRREFERQGHQLPWDREDGRNPDLFREAP
jgi:RHS repeat-associated protein